MEISNVIKSVYNPRFLYGFNDSMGKLVPSFTIRSNASSDSSSYQSFWRDLFHSYSQPLVNFLV